MQKKKRKRKGLAGFLLALGCLSASEFEEDDRGKPASSTPMMQKPGVVATQPVSSGQAVNTSGPVGESSSSAGRQVDTTETTGTTLVGVEGEREKPLEDAGGLGPTEKLVVVPVEPVTLPDDEV